MSASEARAIRLWIVGQRLWNLRWSFPLLAMGGVALEFGRGSLGSFLWAAFLLVGGVVTGYTGLLTFRVDFDQPVHQGQELVELRGVYFIHLHHFKVSGGARSIPMVSADQWIGTSEVVFLSSEIEHALIPEAECAVLATKSTPAIVLEVLASPSDQG
jgi:hypothetical protein